MSDQIPMARPVQPPSEDTPPVAPMVFEIPMARLAPPPPFPTIWQAIVLSALAVALQMVLGLCLWGLSLLTDLSLMTPVGLGIVNLISLGGTMVVGVYWGRVRWADALPLRPLRASLLAPMTITTLGFSVILSDISNVVFWLLPPPDVFDEFMGDLLLGEGGVWQSLFLLCVIAPVSEESLFRGLMLNGMLPRYRPWIAILVTSFLFAAMHLNPWQFFPALFLGALFGWWFLRTRSLWPCLFGHALNNSLPHLSMTLPDFDIPGYTPSPTGELRFQPLWFNVAGFAVFTVGMGWTWLAFRRMDSIGANRVSAASADAPTPMP